MALTSRITTDDTDAGPTFVPPLFQEPEYEYVEEEDLQPPASPDPIEEIPRRRRIIWKHKDSFEPLPPAHEHVPDENIIIGGPWTTIKGTYLSSSMKRILKEITFKSDAELLRAGRVYWDLVVRDDEQICIVKNGIKRTVYIDVSRPSSIRSCNVNMGGIDLADRLISSYRIAGRTRNWTNRYIFN
ncbi:hypothetical protein J6590_074681 [Homalodisca vitripennis]|nr:hypothetical protein J6590_074681 [Homalodisca vitripennis]